MHDWLKNMKTIFLVRGGSGGIIKGHPLYLFTR